MYARLLASLLDVGQFIKFLQSYDDPKSGVIFVGNRAINGLAGHNNIFWLAF
jgi:hypothetical protein